MKRVLLASMLALSMHWGQAQPALQALLELDLAAYEGVWYQVALYPNRFQSQCVSDTTATYARNNDGTLRVANRCRVADGGIDEVVGVARPPRGSPASARASWNRPSWR